MISASIEQRMDKEAMVHIYDGNGLTLKDKQNWIFYRASDESRAYYTLK